MKVQDARAGQAYDGRGKALAPFQAGEGGFFQRDSAIHPPAYAPGYKSSLL
jgi:protocatechuate 3,4-dioxygenase beta subunit